ncbi:MAG: DUF4974 domain-containing protein [Bacteroidales bacterium]|nr:DUF4974 domain-containing protein [Bacteroidales bacterium]
MMTDEKYITHIDRVFSQLICRINRYEKQQRNNGNIMWWRCWSIAASLLLFSFIGYHIHEVNHRQDTNMLVLTGDIEGRKQHTLPDGSTVWLNRGSKLIHPSRFLGKHREVCLSGEAFFDVVQTGNKKFIVKTGKIDIHVLGTKFDVKAYNDENEIITSLVSGSIQIALENGTTGHIALKPGEQLIHNKKNHSTTILQNVNMDMYTSWKDGFLRFSQSPFHEVWVQLERAYGVRIRLKNPLLTERKYNGSIDLRNSIGDILEVIKTTTPMNYTISGKDITITE